MKLNIKPLTWEKYGAGYCAHWHGGIYEITQQVGDWRQIHFHKKNFSADKVGNYEVNLSAAKQACEDHRLSIIASDFGVTLEEFKEILK